MLLNQAQEQKAPIERILNRYAKFYTPAALLLGALVWWWSGDIPLLIGGGGEKVLPGDREDNSQTIACK